jgi:hypothetical protein
MNPCCVLFQKCQDATGGFILIRNAGAGRQAGSGLLSLRRGRWAMDKGEGCNQLPIFTPFIT